MAFGPGERHVIESFAAQLGLPARAAKDASYGFVFDGTGTVTFTPARPGGGVVMSLSWKPARVDGGLMRKCLANGGFDASAGLTVHASLSSDEVILLSVRFEENQISLPMVETCMQDLFARRAAVGR